jgi:hypothetical protein
MSNGKFKTGPFYLSLGASMATDEDAARKARADRLRTQIDKMKTPDKQEQPAPQQKPGGKRESPREFIERRMREIEEQKRK